MSRVTTKYGILEGNDREGYEEFLGIPYAKPPVGELRWREPVDPEPWEGVKEAKEFGNICKQLRMGPPRKQEGPFKLPETFGSEDCLYMNIWTPSTTPEEPYPVMMQIHGGAYSSGSGADHYAKPEPFVKRGVIYITFNYRMGIMGFFAHPWLSEESPHHVSGNYAHFDQIQALKWVYENIAAFGGDPNKITVGGCSAGCGSTQTVINFPGTKGMVSKAILQSSVGIESAIYPEVNKITTMAEMEERGVEYMELLGVKSLEQARAMTYEELMNHPQAMFLQRYHYGTSIGPSLDGYIHPVSYQHQQEYLQDPAIPHLVGNTYDEGGGRMDWLTPEFALTMHTKIFGDKTDDYVAYAKECCGDDQVKIMHDTHLRYQGAKVFAAIHNETGKGPVYVYAFARKNKKTGEADHGLEMRYLLDNFDMLTDPDDTDRAIAEQVQDFWCNFIKNGDPNGEGLPEWRPYTEADPVSMFIDAESGMKTDAEDAPLGQYTVKFLMDKVKKEIGLK